MVRIGQGFFASLILIQLAGCAATPPPPVAPAALSASPVVKPPEAQPNLAPVPAPAVLASVPGVPLQQGRATWYKRSRHTHTTATGEALDDRLFTAAHLTFPLGSFLRVTDIATGNSVIVRVNDRGPYTRNFVIDLSKSAADALGLFRNPRMMVSLELLAGKPDSDHLSVPVSTLPTGAAALAALGGGKPKPGAAKPKPVPAKAGAIKSVKTVPKPAPAKAPTAKAAQAKTQAPTQKPATKAP
ncbi:septal ring lytic transglycosylase RlpA family protein [Elstera sp.]|uniref:septal ring lytic transglycosylase RlpA family protein n=1 Tax=Elstera sp. TaxID=1916664 RepID=UPI0037C1930C